MQQLKKAKLKKFLKDKRLKQTLHVDLVLENIQYARNVAEIFRTADAFKVERIHLAGFSHTPPFGKDLKKVSRSKEFSTKWVKSTTMGKTINMLKNQDFEIFALEITDESEDIYNYQKFQKNSKIALVVGNESHGISKNALARVKKGLFIPMLGKGNSLNVSVATAIALSHIYRSTT